MISASSRIPLEALDVPYRVWSRQSAGAPTDLTNTPRPTNQPPGLTDCSQEFPRRARSTIARARTHTHIPVALVHVLSFSFLPFPPSFSSFFFFSCSCWCVRASASLLAPALERALYKYTRNARSRLHRTTCTQEAFRRKSRARVPDYFPLASRRAPAPGTHNFSFGRARPNLTLLLRGSGSSNELKIIRFTINLLYNIIYIIYNWMIYSGFAGTRSK